MKLLGSLILLTFLAGTLADLPIHCLHEQIVGTWRFTRGPASHAFDTCGYQAPDVNSVHFTEKQHTFPTRDTIEVRLVNPNNVIDAKGQVVGHWTMVYDEGFEFTVDDHTYFAFNKYEPKEGTSLTSKAEVKDYVSHCDETMVGWYRDSKLRSFGCFRGKQLGGARRKAPKKSKVQLTSQSDLAVISPFAIDDSFLVTGETMSKIGSQIDTTDYEFVPHDAASLRQQRRAIVSAREPISEDLLFSPNMEFIQMVNNDETSSWQAGVHEQFVGAKVSDMMRMLGRRRFDKTEAKRQSGFANRAPRFAQISRSAAAQEAYEKAIKAFPKHFDWREYETPIRNQGSCGSCYSMSTVNAFEVRLKIKQKNKSHHKYTQLSPQGVLSCSHMNQGCNGGYPFLVGKFATEMGLMEESCLPYKASDEPECSQCKSSKRYFAKNYRYLGGYYGAGNELAMMKEIYETGPIVVAFEPPSSLFYYTGGIFSGPRPKTEGTSEPHLRAWEQTDHAVTCVGWGEDEKGVKYWILKNTWGPRWGEKGYFRMRRGTDETGIESMPSSFDVIA